MVLRGRTIDQYSRKRNRGIDTKQAVPHQCFISAPLPPMTGPECTALVINLCPLSMVQVFIFIPGMTGEHVQWFIQRMCPSPIAITKLTSAHKYISECFSQERIISYMPTKTFSPEED